MTPVTLTLDLIFNNRVTAGLNAVEDHWTDDFGYAVTPGHGYRDNVQVTLRDLDLGRFDAEGDDYIVNLLNILPGDLIGWTVEEDA